MEKPIPVKLRSTKLRGEIEFTTINDSGVNLRKGSYRMPCGCLIEQTAKNYNGLSDHEFEKKSEDILIYWFENGVPWHDCSLVSEERPSGFIPSDARKGKTPPFWYLLKSEQVSDVSIEQEIQAKGLTAPRITPADIEAEIVVERYFTARDGVLGALAADGVPATSYEQANAAPQSLSLLTFCVLVLRNGFTVTGESACASPENFDAEIGKKIARANAVQKIWPLMGYALKQKLREGGAA